MELLVVIMIIIILAGIAMPMIRGNTEKAKWAEAVRNLGVAKRTLQAYYVELGEYPSVHYWLNGSKKNCPPSLDIGLRDPDDEGRFVYCALKQPLYSPNLVQVCIDENGDGGHTSGEPVVYINMDGGYLSHNGAPEF